MFWEMRGKGIAIITFLFIITGCVTVESLYQKYPSYTVVGKKIEEKTQDVPLKVVYCVTPNGKVICKRRYGEINLACTAMCAKANANSPRNFNPFVTRVEGTYKKSFYIYNLILRSPSGEEVYHKTSKNVFDQIIEGQVFPKK